MRKTPKIIYTSISSHYLSNELKSSIQSAKTRPGTNCGSDHELLVAKFRLKWKKVGKATRPFRHDLNQIPYDYIVEVMNRFKGLDLVDRMSKELWRKVHNIVQQAASIGSLFLLCFLPLEKCHLHICGCWYFSQQSLFQLGIYAVQHIEWCILYKELYFHIYYLFLSCERMHQVEIKCR